MAGYVTKLAGHVYDGANLSGEALINGVFAEITANGVKKVTAVKDTLLRVEEKTELWGNPALRYRMLEMYPLTDILAMEAGSFGDSRDGDKAVMDWLIAVTDDEQLILENYDSMDTGLIEQLLEIFRRVNRIDEKEQKQKNLQTARKA